MPRAVAAIARPPRHVGGGPTGDVARRKRLGIVEGGEAALSARRAGRGGTGGSAGVACAAGGGIAARVSKAQGRERNASQDRSKGSCHGATLCRRLRIPSGIFAAKGGRTGG